MGDGTTSIGALVDPIVASGDLGSPEALQLLDLLYSFLKAINSPFQHYAAADKADWSKTLAEAVGVVLDMALNGPLFHDFAMVLGQALLGGRAAAPTIPSAAVMLPWLVLLGRCAAAVAAQAGTASDSWSVFKLIFVSQLGAFAELIEAGPAAAELNALGYEPETLLQQLRAASATSEAQTRHRMLALILGGSELSFAEMRSALIEQVKADNSLLTGPEDGQQTGCTFLTSIAIRHCCNNPACVNTAGPSEAQLVNGRGNLCGGCRVARYCSRSCLRQHWGQHKPVCKALAAAAVAQAGSAAQVPSG
jgi:hypothetical protein